VAARPTWKGYLKLSLVSVSVKAFTVSDTTRSHIRLNQLHEQCHSRIRYQKTCPIHGEVSNDEIVSGYQIGKDQYVEIDTDELKALRPKNDQSIEIDSFLDENSLDDRFLSDRSYFLVPDGKHAHKPYNLIRDAMADDNLRAVAEVIMSGREQHVLVRPLGKLLVMTVLQHQDELKEPTGFEDQVEDSEVAKEELKLTKQLINGLTPKEWSFDKYVDDYQKNLSALIESKIEGRQLVEAPETEAPRVINLMDALKASIEQIPVPASGPKQSPKKAVSSSSNSAKTKRTAAPSKPRTASKRKASKRKTG
jgi:DNA end-binding protein Ku